MLSGDVSGQIIGIYRDAAGYRGDLYVFTGRGTFRYMSQRCIGSRSSFGSYQLSDSGRVLTLSYYTSKRAADSLCIISTADLVQRDTAHIYVHFSDSYAGYGTPDMSAQLSSEWRKWASGFHPVPLSVDTLSRLHIAVPAGARADTLEIWSMGCGRVHIPLTLDHDTYIEVELPVISIRPGDFTDKRVYEVCYLPDGDVQLHQAGTDAAMDIQLSHRGRSYLHK